MRDLLSVVALAGACLFGCSSPPGEERAPFRGELLAAGVRPELAPIVDRAQRGPSRPALDPERAAHLAREIERRWRAEPATAERDLAYVRVSSGALDEAIELLSASASCVPDPGCRGELAGYLHAAAVRSSDPERLLRALAHADGALSADSTLASARAVRDSVAFDLGFARRPPTEPSALPDSPEGWRALAERLREARTAEDALLDRVADQAPQFARQLGCETLLADAARRALDGHFAAAASSLAAAARLGERLSARGGDDTLRAVAEEVEAATRAPHTADRDRYLAAVSEYGAAREAIREERYAEALRLLSAALPALETGGSALAPWAAHAHAVAARFANGESPREIFERLLATAPGTAPALHAHTHWSLAVLADLAGDLARAAELFGEAISRFERLGESENVAVLRSFRAFTLYDLGRDREAGADLMRAAALRDSITTFDALEIVLDSWLALVVTPRFPELAWRFQDDLIAAARASGRPSMLVQSLLVRGENPTAPAAERLRFLDEALAVAPAIEEERERRRKLALLGIARARALLEADPSACLAALDESLAFYSEPQFEHLRLEGLVIRARALLELGNVAEATHAHREGLSLLEASLRRSPSYRDRHRSLREARALFEGLATLELHGTGGPAAALAVVRQARALSIATRRSERTIAAGSAPAARELPPGVTLVEYATLGGVLHAWTTHGSTTTFGSLSASSDELRARVASFEGHLRADRHDAVLALGRELSSLLLPSLRDLPSGPLWIVPDPSIADLAWSALADPLSPEPLGVAREIVLLAGIGSARALTPFQGDAEASIEARLVGASRVEDAPLRLAELSAVASEIAAIRSLYRRTSVHLGPQATPAAVLERPMARILHIAAHAVPGVGPAEAPRLVLAPDGTHPSGMLDAFEIADQDLSGVDLVLLPACGSARGLGNATEAPLSLATAFLAAGAGAVVASLWAVEDHETASVMRIVHDQILAGQSLDSALRGAIAETFGRFPARPSKWAVWSIWSAPT